MIDTKELPRPPKAKPSKRVDFGWLPMYAQWAGGSVSVHMQTLDATTGEPIEVSASASHGASRVIRDLAATLLVHELDEQLRVDGELVMDPHGHADTCFSCGRPWADRADHDVVGEAIERAREQGFAGQVVSSMRLGDARHEIYLVECEFDTDDEPRDRRGFYIVAADAHEGGGRPTLAHMSDAVHVLQNMTDAEKWLISTREATP